jgi:hypothetical protein
LAHRSLAPPLGLAPLGYFGENLDRDFARPPLSRFAVQRRIATPAGVPEYQWVFTRPHPGTLLAQGLRTRRPSWGSCTGSIPYIQARFPPGYVFTSHCVVHRCRPANDLWRDLLPYRSCRDRLRCRALRPHVRRLLLAVPFRVFGLAARPWVLPPRDVLWGLAARQEFLTRRSIAPIG